MKRHAIIIYFEARRTVLSAAENREPYSILYLFMLFCFMLWMMITDLRIVKVSGVNNNV